MRVSGVEVAKQIVGDVEFVDVVEIFYFCLFIYFFFFNVVAM